MSKHMTDSCPPALLQYKTTVAGRNKRPPITAEVPRNYLKKTIYLYIYTYIYIFAVRNERPPITAEVPRKLADIIELCWHAVPKARPSFGELKMQFKALSDAVPCDVPSKSSKVEQVSTQVEMCVCACVCEYIYMCIRIFKVSFKATWSKFCRRYQCVCACMCVNIYRCVYVYSKCSLRHSPTRCRVKWLPNLGKWGKFCRR